MITSCRAGIVSFIVFIHPAQCLDREKSLKIRAKLTVIKMPGFLHFEALQNRQSGLNLIADVRYNITEALH